MKAHGTAIVGGEGLVGSKVQNVVEGVSTDAAKLAEALERPVIIEEGLRDLLGIAPDQTFTYTARIREGVVDDPRADIVNTVEGTGALVTYVDVYKGDKWSTTHKLWIDDETRIDERLTTALGADAQEAAAAGSFIYERVNEVTTGARLAAKAHTAQLREAQVNRPLAVVTLAAQVGSLGLEGLVEAPATAVA